jgi:hypothetical protein
MEFRRPIRGARPPARRLADSIAIPTPSSRSPPCRPTHHPVVGLANASSRSPPRLPVRYLVVPLVALSSRSVSAVRLDAPP